MDDETTDVIPGWPIALAILCAGAAGVWVYIRNKKERP